MMIGSPSLKKELWNDVLQHRGLFLLDTVNSNFRMSTYSTTHQRQDRNIDVQSQINQPKELPTTGHFCVGTI